MFTFNWKKISVVATPSRETSHLCLIIIKINMFKLYDLF
uniref:Uncharacterized protein n=1 Tax=Ciona intestinalis TaxID=7719 RepID=H2XYL7_CIOIN